MKSIKTHTVLQVLIALVWFVNGFFCKVLGLVPRHEQIVAHITDESYSPVLTLLIGLGEIILSIWVVSNYKPRWNAVVQIGLVALMNIIEFFLVPDLLLWGKFNAVFALLFISIVYYSAFLSNPQSHHKSRA